MEIRVERISKGIDRATFDCGEPALNEYFAKHARQNDENQIASCFVMLNSANKAIGYYAYSMAQIARISLPLHQAKGIPGYPLGAIRIGRLARDNSVRGTGCGELLLKDCLKRIVGFAQKEDHPAFKFVIVDAKNDNAIQFYKKFGFTHFLDQPNSLLMALDTIEKACKSGHL